MSIFLNWLAGQNTKTFTLTEKMAIIIVFSIFGFAFNLFSIDVGSSSRMVMDELSGSISKIEAGSLFNKIYWTMLFCFSLYTLVLNKRPFFNNVRRVRSILIVCLLLLLSVIWSEYPLITLRRAVLSIFAVFSLLIGIIYIKDRRCLISVIYKVVIVAFIFNVITLIAGFGFSDGLDFSGIHGHKNTTGLIASLALWITLYARSFHVTKISLKFNTFYVFGWLVILLLTHSKTSIALVIFSPIIWFGLVVFSRMLKIQIFTSFVALVLFFTLPFTIFLLFKGVGLIELVGDMGGDISLTGRDFIWNFVLGYINERPILGVGYGAFWDVGEGAFNQGSHGHGRAYLRFLHQAHNGYLDILVSLGIVGLLAVLNVIRGIWQAISKEVTQGSNLAHFGGVLIIFILLHNVTESSLLRTTHINWIMTLTLFFIFTTIERKEPQL